MSKVIIIAEAGINHNGDINIARRLIEIAKYAGADYIKFQTFVTELNISKTASKARYQIDAGNNKKETQYEMAKRVELSFLDFEILHKYCEEVGIGFLSTGFDLPSLDFLDTIGQKFFKIPSAEINNKPYLQHIACKNKPVVMSTGMADLSEIEAAVHLLIEGGLTREMITILHCNTEYPTPMGDVNLMAMLTIRDAFKVRVGYSDHTMGIEVPIAAVALGAMVIEKHFTLDRSFDGPDHRASIEPSELHDMVSSIRNIEQAIGGTGLKEPSPSERPNKAIARKSIHLRNNVAAGDIILSDNLVMKRPGDGISPMLIDKVVGRKVAAELDAGHKLNWEDFR